jgi:hypothetical protein
MVAYNLGVKHKWQVGLQAHVLSLANTSSTVYVGDEANATVGGDDKRIVYSQITTVICAIGNRKLRLNANNEFYIGAAVGFGIARNNGKYTPKDSYVAPDGGRGMVFGGQIGYTLNITPSFALNLEAAPRYMCLAYDAMAPYYVKPHDNLYYNVWAYPVTIGFRIKLNRGDNNEVPSFDIDKYQRRRENWK